MNLKLIEEIEKEVTRFTSRLEKAKQRLIADPPTQWGGSKETAALKRAALDLKNELTKLNKSRTND